MDLKQLNLKGFIGIIRPMMRHAEKIYFRRIGTKSFLHKNIITDKSTMLSASGFVTVICHTFQPYSNICD